MLAPLICVMGHDNGISGDGGDLFDRELRQLHVDNC
jgi:hypothetical protein